MLGVRRNPLPSVQDKPDWGLFVAWTLLGIAWGFVFVGVASIGLLIFRWRSWARPSSVSFFGLPGVLTGLGVAPLIVAYFVAVRRAVLPPPSTSGP